MSEGETRTATRHRTAALLITTVIALAQAADDTPGLGPNDFDAPSVVEA